MADTDSGGFFSRRNLSRIVLAIAFLISVLFLLGAYLAVAFQLFGDSASPEDIHNGRKMFSQAGVVWSVGSILAWLIRDRRGLVLGFAVLPLAVTAWAGEVHDYRSQVADLAVEHDAVTELLGQLQLPAINEIVGEIDDPVDLSDARSDEGFAGVIFRYGGFGDQKGLDAAIRALPATLVASQCDARDEWYEYELDNERWLILTLQGYPADESIADLRIVYSRDLYYSSSSSGDEVAHCLIIVPQD